jgi:hypothetical protein
MAAEAVQGTREMVTRPQQAEDQEDLEAERTDLAVIKIKDSMEVLEETLAAEEAEAQEDLGKAPW